MIKRLAILLLMPASLCFAEESNNSKEKQILLPKNLSDEDFDYPIVTDESYPFLLERDNFQDTVKEQE